MLQVSIGEQERTVKQVATRVWVDTEPCRVAWQREDAYTWVGQSAGRQWRLVLLGHDAETSTVRLMLNGKRLVVGYETLGQRLLKSIGIDPAASLKVTELKAPMPGLIKQIPIAPGQSVAQGEPLLVLEAMKMENVIKSPSDVVIESIQVTQGDAVEKNQVLVTFA